MSSSYLFSHANPLSNAIYVNCTSMGCVRDTDRRSQEETLLSSNERLLGIRNCTAEEVDLVVRKYCSTTTVKEAAFELIWRKLKLSTKEIPACKLIPDFYKGVKGTIEGLSRNRLLVLGIMHAEGSTWAKLDLLFDVADVKCEDKANSDVLSKVFEEMLELATKQTRKLVSQQQISRFPSIFSYFNLLEEGRANAQHYLQVRLLKKDIVLGREKFLSRVRRAGIDNIAECDGLRALVLRHPSYQPRIHAHTESPEETPESEVPDR